MLQIHRDYVKAGSQAIITNTLTMNRLYVDTHAVDIDVERVNRAGAKLAIEAIGSDGYVLGNLSSTGQLLDPYGTYLEDEFIDTFKEQATYLAEGGVAGFIIETIIDLREAVCAVRACKAVSTLPVIACISYFSRSDGGRTAMGNSATDCARVLTDEGADAIGANCGSIDPEQMAEIASILQKNAKVSLNRTLANRDWWEAARYLIWSQRALPKGSSSVVIQARGYWVDVAEHRPST